MAGLSCNSFSTPQWHFFLISDDSDDFMRLRGKKSEILTISAALKSEGKKTQPCGLRKHNQEILAHEVGGEKSSEIRKK